MVSITVNSIYLTHQRIILTHSLSDGAPLTLGNLLLRFSV